MATYSANTTVKINAAVSGSVLNTGTLLGAIGAAEYAIVTLGFTGSFSGTTGIITVTVGGQFMDVVTVGPNGLVPLQRVFYVGPGQGISVTRTGGTVDVTSRIAGVRFINTP